MTDRDRMEPRDPLPVVRGRCDWCGGKTVRGRVYCNPKCRVSYNNLLARQGKSLMQMLKLLTEDRDRKAKHE